MKRNYTASYPKVSIVFPTLNGWKDTKDCLESIEGLDYSKDNLEVIVVDNGSTDGTVEKLQNSNREAGYSLPKLQVIKNIKNLGFARAVNKGIKKARGNYILVTNNDVLFGKESLKKMIGFIVENPNAGVVGPYGYNYNFYGGLFKKLPISNLPTKADWIAGSAMLFSKSLWQKLKGFDEGFFFTGEDVDFCLRTKYIGKKSIQIPNCRISHKDGKSINRPELSYFKYFEGYKSKFRLILKHGNLLQIISSTFLQFFIYLPYKTLLLGEKSGKALVSAFIWNIKNLRSTLKARTLV